ncbi:ABC transporter permease [Alicyclobacillus acidocaldarius]|uniref:ABC-2 type transporter transmembrane domain-containing protein n=1 Tax=Alicyclobacillus acidocaldarius subsp. acidocaldarius (strain ATCC 27009 / DSM 446 / BCRC 14685 / JCM 5260 / KCTC 1825 / NBRC 15652 / NCIMB 11725 / NRRL B-14509 / 104-IA) TaxID=521098 RepID=C8WPY1_ALIAD|nr:hypothetical protein Aaci_0021 [Alicyclobacillus acidocaldarius subsp. acidocaldarius DSM 446]
MSSRRWLVAGFFAPIVVICIFMFTFIPAVRSAGERLSELKVAVVNEAGSQGVALQKQLAKHLPFTAITGLDERAARQKLLTGNVEMVIRIPSDFYEKLASGNAHLDFELTDALSPNVKSMMQLTEARVTQATNAAVLEVAKWKLDNALMKQVDVAPANTSQSKEVAVSAAQREVFLVKLMQQIQRFPTQPVRANEVVVASAPAVAEFLPFLTVVTFFIGSILASLAAWFALKPFDGSARRRYMAWFETLGYILIVSFAAAATVVGVAQMYGVYPVVHAFRAVCSLAISFGAGCGLVGGLIYLLRLPGIGLYALLFPFQMLSSGIALPFDMLPQGYQSVVRVLPALHVTRVVNWLYVGVGDVSADLKWLGLTVLLAALVMGLRLVFVRRRQVKEDSI